MRPFCLCLALTISCATPPSPPAVTTPAPTIQRAGAAESIAPPADDRLPGNVRPSAYHVRLDLDLRRGADYGGQVRIELQLTEATDTIWLHSENHEVYAHGLSVEHQGRTQRAAGTTLRRGGASDWLAVKTPRPIGPGKAQLLLHSRGEMTTPLFGMYRVQHAGHWYIYTQFEALGARKAFPCFDEPNYKAPFTFQIRSPKADRLFANAPLARPVSAQATGSGMSSRPRPRFQRISLRWRLAPSMSPMRRSTTSSVRMAPACESVC